MHPILKLVLGIVAGVIVSFCVISLVESLSAKLYPMKTLTPSIEQIIAEMKTLPLAAYLLVLGGYVLSSFFGGYTAARIASAERKIIAALTVGFVLLLGGIVLFITLPHPLWMSILSSISFLFFAWLGGLAAQKRVTLEHL
ncbi:MAG: hypothetical protein JNJ58_03670 [Chitinophagaceae bacterium]|nr:hypothetical protein [Chitinophagaceae bacterium]